MGRTLVIVKPDAVERRLCGEILARFERRGLEVAAAQLLTIGPDLAARHYAEHRDKPFYDELVRFIGRSPSLVMVLEAPGEAWRLVRSMMGPTNPAEAAPGTIRGDLGIETTENLVHGSDSEDSARREISLFFPDLEPQG